MKRSRVLPFAMALCLLLAACGQSADAPASLPADSIAGDAGQSAGGAQSGTDLSYLADFDYSALFDANGYVDGVTATDYVTLPEGFAAMTLPAGSDEVSDDDVDALIEEQVLSYYAEDTQITDRAAEMGDTVHIDYVGSVDGVEFDGGSTQGAGTDLELTGSNYIDDFEEQIAGHMPGDTFNVEVTFPDPYTNNPDMAGKDAVFVTTLHYIVGEPVLPELTDDFVQTNLSQGTDWQTAQDVREYFREALLFNQQSSAIYDQLDAGVTYGDELPQPVADFFRDFALYNIYAYTQQYGIDADTLLTQSGYESTEQYLDDMQDGIVDNGRTVLLIQALAEELGIVCDDDTLAANAEGVFGTDDLTVYEQAHGRGYLKMMMLERLVLNRLIENATVAAE